MSWEKVGKQLGVSKQSCMNAYSRSRCRLGLAGSGDVNQSAIEHQDPDKAAEALVELSAREQSMADIAREVNLPYSTVRGLAKRLSKGMVPLERALGEIKRTELRDLYADVNWRVLARVTDADIEKASLRDKLVAAGIATDKMNIMDGQPTQVFSVPELENLDKLAVMLLREVERRNLVRDVNPHTGSVEIEAGEPER